MAEQKQKTPPRKVWNWPLEKEQFFMSEFLEPTSYFKAVHGTMNGTIQGKIVGWAKEKEAWQEEESKKALKEFSRKRSRLLAQGLNDALTAAQEGLNVLSKEKLGIKAQKALKTFWHILRVESGLPTNVLHNTNVNENLERDGDAADDLSKALEQDSALGQGNKVAAEKTRHPGKGKGRKTPPAA